MIFDNASPGQKRLSSVVYMSVQEAYCDIYLLLMLLLIEAFSCLSQSHSVTDSVVRDFVPEKVRPSLSWSSPFLRDP